MSDEPKPAEVVKPAEPTPMVINNGPSLLSLIAAFTVSSVVSIGLVFGGVMYFRGEPNPTPLPTPVVVPKVEPVVITHDDAIATLDGIRLNVERTKLLVGLVNAGQGTFLLRYQPVGKAEIVRTVVVSGDKPIPPPKPPIPVPPEPPTPPIPPGPTGPLTILLVRESGDSTPEMAMLIRDLRTGPVADYLKSKQHALGILDTNAKDADGKPSPAIEEWRTHFSGLTLPALVVYDPTTKRVLSKQSITSATTANQIMDAIKKDGG